MILNTGSRTDIPAYYGKWFYNRVREGYVLVRNPYFPAQVTKYLLRPEVVDVMVFCTKNPEPMMNNDEFKNLISTFDIFWFVTITPYGKDIEPFVPPKEQAIQSFQTLSALVGKQRISWRYDPVFITDKYSVKEHIKQFRAMAGALADDTSQCVVSFIDLYEKTKKNFRGIRSVTAEEQEQLITAFAEIAGKFGMQIHLCCENVRLVQSNVDADGCMSKTVLENALGCKLEVPHKQAARKECDCLLGADIGAYNTCGHGCLYCYANYDMATVAANRMNHNPSSPFLIGGARAEDIVKNAVQKSWKNGQLDLFGFI